MPHDVTMLPVGKVRTDGGTQSRIGLDPDTVQEYREVLREEEEFPPIVVYHDGVHYWLSSGFHRLEACVLEGKTFISAEVRHGTARDALAHSLACNKRHGLRRTNKDVRHAIYLALADPEWSKLSDHKVAKLVLVTQPTVSAHRAALINFISAGTVRIARTESGTWSYVEASPAKDNNGTDTHDAVDEPKLRQQVERSAVKFFTKAEAFAELTGRDQEEVRAAYLEWAARFVEECRRRKLARPAAVG